GDCRHLVSTDLGRAFGPGLLLISLPYLALRLAREIVREVGDVLVADTLQRLRHGGVITVAAVRLVLAQRPRQVILALACDARHVRLAGEIRLVAEIATVLRGERAAALDARRLAG